jgi:MFS family permease
LSLPPSPRLNAAVRPTTTHRLILVLAWGVWTLGFYSLMVFSFVLQAVQDAFKLSEGGLANLTAVAVGMTGVGGLLFGWLSDRFGRRPAVATAIVVFSLGNLICGLGGGIALFTLGRALTGLGVGGSWGGGQALLGETFPPAWRGRYGALAQTGAPLGLGLATVAGSFLAPRIGWQNLFLLSVAPLLLLLLFLRVPESDVWLEHRNMRKALPRQGPILLQLLRSDLRGRFFGAFILTGLNMSAYWFAIVWLPRYLQKQRGLSIFGSGWWTLVFVAGSILGYLGFGWVSDRGGRRRSFSVFSVITALGLGLVTLFWDQLADHPGLGLACMAIAGFGTGTWSCYGPYFSELFPTRVRGAAMAVIMNVTRGVQFVAPLVIAAVAGHWGLAGGVALASGFALLSGAWIWTLPETAGREIVAT